MRKKKDRSNNYGQVLGTVYYNLYYNLVYSLFTSSSPLNRLLIPSTYFNLPRLPIRVLLLCQTAVPTCIIIKAKSSMPYAFIHIPLHFTSTPLIISPPFETSFSRSLGIYLFNTLFRYPDAPHSISKRKSTVSFHSCLRYRCGRSAIFFFFVSFLFFCYIHISSITRIVSLGNLSFSYSLPLVTATWISLYSNFPNMPTPSLCSYRLLLLGLHGCSNIIPLMYQ